MDTLNLLEFGKLYTAAWCSQEASRVAGFYSENGSLQINNGPPSIGRSAITNAAREFMTAFPDLVVKINGIGFEGKHAIYHWTLTGTNTGPGGSGNFVCISGYEEWTFDVAGLILESKGHFDEVDFNRQLNSSFENK